MFSLSLAFCHLGLVVETVKGVLLILTRYLSLSFGMISHALGRLLFIMIPGSRQLDVFASSRNILECLAYHLPPSCRPLQLRRRAMFIK